MMTSRERMLTALSNGRPDRLPCQVHGWMDYYLHHYLGGMDWWQAYERFGMDIAMYVSPQYRYDEKNLANWIVERLDMGVDSSGSRLWQEMISNPKGVLHQAGGQNEITSWVTEHILKTEQDFEIWNEFYPVPVAVDLTILHKTYDRLGDRGIIRSHPFSPGQGSPWQSFCTLIGTAEAIYMSVDNPEFLHHALDEILKKTLHVTELWKGSPADMVEIAGGAGSSTVISPTLFEEFCLPYDRRQVEAFHSLGIKTVTHLCGGLMPMLELVARSGTDGLETMTPKSMGGDCDLKEASRRVGDRLFFIGGFDQQSGFERGTPKAARRQVFECFEATKDHAGYIIAPSDHFFHGAPENIQAFADAAKECVY